MLAKKNRVVTGEVDKIFKEGRFLNSSNLTFKYIILKSAPPRISFIAPKNIAKHAVERNLLRRHGYQALKKYFHKFPPGLIGVFIFKKLEDNILIIEDEIKNILAKVN